MPAGKTYEPISTQTLSTAVATVTFSSIPQTYTDLICLVEGRDSRADFDDGVSIRFNSDTAANYSWMVLGGDGTSGTSTRLNNTTSMLGRIISASATANARSNLILHINNYSNTTTYKTLLERFNEPPTGGADYFMALVLALWRNTAAITTLSFFSEGGNFNTGCTFTLYGIKAA